jgi:hypothetical protein
MQEPWGRRDGRGCFLHYSALIKRVLSRYGCKIKSPISQSARKEVDYGIAQDDMVSVMYVLAPAGIPDLRACSELKPASSCIMIPEIYSNQESSYEQKYQASFQDIISLFRAHRSHYNCLLSPIGR